jgi:hypothetical protein
VRERVDIVLNVYHVNVGSHEVLDVGEECGLRVAGACQLSQNLLVGLASPIAGSRRQRRE